jgi:hypothetical protein
MGYAQLVKRFCVACWDDTDLRGAFLAQYDDLGEFARKTIPALHNAGMLYYMLKYSAGIKSADLLSPWESMRIETKTTISRITPALVMRNDDNDND